MHGLEPRFDNDAISVTSSSQRAGLTVIAVSGLLSTITTVSLLGWIVWNAYFCQAARDAPPGSKSGWRGFVRSDSGLYLLSLLTGNLLHGVGFSMNFAWTGKASPQNGPVCAAQGFIIAMGDLSTVFWTFAIGLHTFVLLFLARRPPSWSAPTALIFGWAVVFILPILGVTVLDKKDDQFFTGDGSLWCWVGGDRDVEKLLYFYVWAFICLFSSLVFYVLIYVRTIGIFSVGAGRPAMPRPKNGSRWSCVAPWAVKDFGGASSSNNAGTSDGTGSGSGQASGSNNASRKTFEVGKHVQNVARKLLLYPVIYTFVLVPVSVVKFGSFSGWVAPFGLVVFSGVIFALSGLADAILFIFTRHSFIRTTIRSRSRPRIEVSTHQVTTVIEMNGTRLDVDEDDSDISVHGLSEISEGKKEDVESVASRSQLWQQPSYNQ